jgi:hypothetical protein
VNDHVPDAFANVFVPVTLTAADDPLVIEPGFTPLAIARPPDERKNNPSAVALDRQTLWIIPSVIETFVELRPSLIVSSPLPVSVVRLDALPSYFVVTIVDDVRDVTTHVPLFAAFANPLVTIWFPTAGVTVHDPLASVNVEVAALICTPCATTRSADLVTLIAASPSVPIP